MSVVSPNPHFVQFIRREIEDAQGNFKADVISKGYPLSSSQNPVWHTDALGAPNPFYDQGPGVSIQRGSYNHVAMLTIFDQPSFSAAEEVYADEQWAGSTETLAGDRAGLRGVQLLGRPQDRLDARALQWPHGIPAAQSEHADSRGSRVHHAAAESRRVRPAAVNGAAAADGERLALACREGRPRRISGHALRG